MPSVSGFLVSRSSTAQCRISIEDYIMHTHFPITGNASSKRRAMRWSLSIGLLMFVGKGLAYIWTGSASILSDAAESVVHVIAVAFAAYSLWLSEQPPDHKHLYGHEKISFFSAGFEGALIMAAACFIIYEAIVKWMTGLVIERIELGTLVIASATLINGILGWYLIRTGSRERSLVLVANGKHVLTDSLTSLGVIVGLGLVWLTGWREFDPIMAIAIAIHILWSGISLVRESFRGLMDEGDPAIDAVLRRVLDEWVASSGGRYHDLRHRSGGNVIWVEVHLLFPGELTLEAAHEAATSLEHEIERNLKGHPVVVTTHLEPMEQHEQHHASGEGRGSRAESGEPGRERRAKGGEFTGQQR
jgi:cation diffusion facilitator family transporter